MNDDDSQKELVCQRCSAALPQFPVYHRQLPYCSDACVRAEIIEGVLKKHDGALRYLKDK